MKKSKSSPKSSKKPAPARSLGKAQNSQKEKTAAFERDPFYHSKEYRQWRQAVFKRDGYRCRWCRSKRNLQADHILPRCARPDLALEVSNGRTLCKRCHKMTPTYGFAAARYKGII